MPTIIALRTIPSCIWNTIWLKKNTLWLKITIGYLEMIVSAEQNKYAKCISKLETKIHYITKATFFTMRTKTFILRCIIPIRINTLTVAFACATCWFIVPAIIICFLCVSRPTFRNKKKTFTISVIAITVTIGIFHGTSSVPKKNFQNSHRIKWKEKQK